MYAIRGAISVEKNTARDILEATKKVMKNIMKENKLQKDELVSIITTTTDDLTKVYPGKALREMGYKLTPILCMQEMKVEKSGRKMIRLLVHVDGNKNKDQVEHQYLNKAKQLRPDLAE